jgi:hypothetical protein
MSFDWNQVVPYIFGGGGLVVLTAAGKGVQWLVSIPQRQSQSTAQKMTALQVATESLHTRELAFRDSIIAEKDQNIAERDQVIASLKEEIETLKKADRPQRRSRE